MEDPRGTLFVSMPSLLDPSLAPEGRHIVHASTPDWIDAWQVRQIVYICISRHVGSTYKSDSPESRLPECCARLAG